MLDEAPEELVRLVSYLQAMSEQLVIDLITISSYTVNGSQILVPQRVEAERQQSEVSSSVLARPPSERGLVGGAEDFIAGIDSAPEEIQPLLRRLADWAAALEQAGWVNLSTYHGKGGILTLLPRLLADDAGLVTIFNNNGQAYLQFWRSVFERCAPKSLERIDQSFLPIKQGNTTREISNELLDALTDAYKEAVGGEIIVK